MNIQSLITIEKEISYESTDEHGFPMILYLAYIYFYGNETSDFGNFSSGLILGLSIGCNLVGIILTVAYMSKNNKEKDK